MSPNEERVYNETKLRNLKRRLSKLSQHVDMTGEYLKTKKLITELES